jgi:hypothetical protein
MAGQMARWPDGQTGSTNMMHAEVLTSVVCSGTSDVGEEYEVAYTETSKAGIPEAAAKVV